MTSTGEHLPHSPARVAAVLSASLVLAACGGTSDEATPAPAETVEQSDSATGSDELHVAVIGDSIGYGQADCGGCVSFVDLYADALGERLGLPVQADNLSTHDGLTSPQLVQRLRTEDYYREGVEAADVLVVSIGHNDTPWAVDDDSCDGPTGDEPVWSDYQEPCMTTEARDQARQLRLFLSEASELRGGEPTVQVVTTVYNDWIGVSGVPVAATRPTTTTLDAFSEAACDAAREADAVCLDSYHAFNGPQGLEPAGTLLAPDTVHPSAEGHRVIADLLMQVDVEPVLTSR